MCHPKRQKKRVVYRYSLCIDALGYEPVDGKAVMLRMDSVIEHFVNEEQVQAAKKERNKVSGCWLSNALQFWLMDWLFFFHL